MCIYSPDYVLLISVAYVEDILYNITLTAFTDAMKSSNQGDFTRNNLLVFNSFLLQHIAGQEKITFKQFFSVLHPGKLLPFAVVWQ